MKAQHKCLETKAKKEEKSKNNFCMHGYFKCILSKSQMFEK